MEKSEIIQLIDKKIDYTDLQRAKSLIETYGYTCELRTQIDAHEIRELINKKCPVIIRGYMLVGHNGQRFVTSGKQEIPMDRSVNAIVVTKAPETIRQSPKLAILGKVEAGFDLQAFQVYIEPLTVQSVQLPPHSIIFNFVEPTPEQVEQKIVSMLQGVQIYIYEKTGYVDQCLHEIGHLFWRTRMTFEDQEQFKDLYSRLKVSAIFEYKWEHSDAEEMFCTIYKWYMKSMLINQSFYNILEHEEPTGLRLLHSVFDRITIDTVNEDVWELSQHDVEECLSPKFDTTTGALIRKKGVFDRVKDLELPESVLKNIDSMDDGVVYVNLIKGKRVPVDGNRIDWSKITFTKNLEKSRSLTDGKPVLYLDMDGVVAGFSEHYKDCFGIDPHDVDSFTVSQAVATRPHFFRELPVIPKGKDLYDILAEKFTVVFLTTPMDSMAECKRDKIAWAREHFPAVHTVIFSSNKAEYAGSEQAILIDDMAYNRTPFMDAGGTAIDSALDNDTIMQKIDAVLNPEKEIARLKRELASMDVDTDPSEQAKQSGNYKKGRIKFKSMNIAIENPKGSIRFGFDSTGTKWVSKMKAHYGYIVNGENGADGDKVDVFIGDALNSSKAFIVDQVNPQSGIFDEHKVMLGYTCIEDAQNAYMANYQAGWKGFGGITQTNTKKLREWIASGPHLEPYGELQTIISFTAETPLQKALKNISTLFIKDK